MNGMILQTPTENKDIKVSAKKNVDTKSTEGENLFENLIAKLVEEEGKSKNSNFLLAKLLNLSSDFTDKGKIISQFSKGDIQSDIEGALEEKVSLEDLFKVALALKSGENLPNMSSELKNMLQDKEVIAQIKDAKNIKELLNIAEKNGIKVKNFEFLNAEAALDSKEKKIVQKITSEEIFKMAEQKLVQNEPSVKENMLTRLMNQEVQEKKTGKNKQQTTLASLLTKEHTKKETMSKVTPEKPIMMKAEVAKNVEKGTQTAEPTLEVDDIPKQESLKQNKPERSAQNTLETLLKNENGTKELKPQQPSKVVREEPVIKSEVESKETQLDKSSQVTDLKTESTQKTKDIPDVKRTLNTFAMEFKEKVEAYKPPLMKVNMQLNPGNLGDVDVTLVSRGNNLQVNINSNANTMAIFVQNQADFKNSLVNMGFSDLQMNFGDKRGEERDQQQKNNQQTFYHDESENEEFEGIEMIIPNYV